jgi:hypothetical protein
MESAHKKHMMETMEAVQTAHSAQINALKTEHREQVAALQIRVAAQTSTTEFDDDIRLKIIDMIGDQLRHYFKGFHMKLNDTILSLPALLRDGYVARMMIDIYRLHDDLSPEQVIREAVSKRGDMEMIDDTIHLQS